MYKIYHGDAMLFNSWFRKNEDVHGYNTRQMDHYHIPFVRTELGKSSLRYHGVIIWNNILNIGIDPEVSEFKFSKSLKQCILQNMLKN